jgi:hypothetical protein
MCHNEDCVTSDSDIAQHPVPCCYRELYNLKQLTRRHKKEWGKLENYPKELKVKFFHYLNQRFNEIVESNLPPIRPEKPVTHEMEMLVHQRSVTKPIDKLIIFF